MNRQIIAEYLESINKYLKRKTDKEFETEYTMMLQEYGDNLE